MTIIAAYQDAGTYRGAAAICGTTPKTVKRVIERAQAGGVRPPPKDRVRNYTVVADLVAQRVKKSNGRITAKRLQPAARTAGYAGSARNFRRLVAQAKKDCHGGTAGRGGGESHRQRPASPDELVRVRHRQAGQRRRTCPSRRCRPRLRARHPPHWVLVPAPRWRAGHLFATLSTPTRSLSQYR